MVELFFFTAPENLASAFFFGVFGLLIGSFLNVVIHRLPIMMQRESDNYVASESGKEPVHTSRYNLIVPRSACPHCAHQISALENIPIISYLMIGGKCRGCKTPISKRYPIIEAITGVLSGFMIWHFGSGVAGMGAVVFVWFLVAMTFIDADTQLLPDDLTLPLMWIGLLLNLHGTYTSTENAIIGAVAGYLSLWSVYWAFKLITGKEGMGYGDFKLLAALGAWMGWGLLPLVILLSSAVGAVIGISMMVLGKLGKGKPIPFGPYLAIAGLIALLWGHRINSEYLGLFQ
ncbi:prepilin peptidase [Undibacterium sp.]|uniref:prepilin peptidase n=1 Tax=Undibacterium sp. TaxID=1914977 RepID=UPI003752536C